MRSGEQEMEESNIDRIDYVLTVGGERGPGENDGGGGTNTVFLCIQSATSSGKLLAPLIFQVRSLELEPSLAQNQNHFCWFGTKPNV